MLITSKGFAPHKQCHILSGYLASNVHRLGRPNVEPFFNYRQISLYDVDDDIVRNSLIVLREDMARKLNGAMPPTTFWPDYTNLVIWYEGMDMNAHYDNLPPHFTHRKYSAVLYLNECEGGETYFPDTHGDVPTETGKLIMFPSGQKHGVRTITKGMRFTLAAWLTDDQSKWEEPLRER